jgi:hypothetical protein
MNSDSQWRVAAQMAEALRDLEERTAMLRPQASGAKAVLRPVQFKEGSHLTCLHGRFWQSCTRCRYDASGKRDRGIRRETDQSDPDQTE